MYIYTVAVRHIVRLTIVHVGLNLKNRSRSASYYIPNVARDMSMSMTLLLAQGEKLSGSEYLSLSRLNVASAVALGVMERIR